MGQKKHFSTPKALYFITVPIICKIFQGHGFIQSLERYGSLVSSRKPKHLPLPEYFGGHEQWLSLCKKCGFAVFELFEFKCLIKKPVLLFNYNNYIESTNDELCMSKCTFTVKMQSFAFSVLRKFAMLHKYVKCLCSTLYVVKINFCF